jgi:hypothetical protein
MIERKTYRVLPFNQLLLILIGALVLYLVVDFGRQVGVSHQRREELHQLELKVESAQAETVALQEQYNYATSPQAAEEWARRNGLTKPDEVLAVFVGDSTDSYHAGEKRPKASTSPTSPREAWWDLFFGTR